MPLSVVVEPDGSDGHGGAAEADDNDDGDDSEGDPGLGDSDSLAGSSVEWPPAADDGRLAQEWKMTEEIMWCLGPI